MLQLTKRQRPEALFKLQLITCHIKHYSVIFAHELAHYTAIIVEKPGLFMEIRHK